MSYDLSRTLFSIADRKFTCGEFLNALKYYGVYEDWQARVSAGKSLVKHADAEKRDMDLEVLAEMTNEFRYSQKLLTTEEFNDWQQSIGLQITDFENYLQRAYWSLVISNESESEVEEPVTDREFFSEIYFSGAFNGLLQSWQQRLLAWKEIGATPFPDLEELEKSYREFCLSVLKCFDTEQWVNCHRMEMTGFNLVCLSGELEVLLEVNNSKSENFTAIAEQRNLKLLEISSFYKELPYELQDYLEVVEPGEVFGPVSYSSEFLLCRLNSKTLPESSDEEVVGELQEEFRQEVWKTLKVKYVSD